MLCDINRVSDIVIINSSPSIVLPDSNSVSLFKNKCFVVFVTEIEAKEACKWLRAAGFPQYAQMYEGEYFVINYV